ncbi:MAG: histidine kinase, partial [Shimia sp.]|nr:histidine kinase [Shimia sp.]
MFTVLHEGRFTLIGPDGERFAVVANTEPALYEMAFSTILKMLLALVVIMVAVGIWVFAPPSFAVAMLALSGLGLATNMICGSFLELTEITVAPQVFHIAISIASWGGATFAYALLAVIWTFPRPITQFPWAVVLLGVGVLLQLNIAFQLIELPINSFEIAHLIPAPVAVVASTLQWLRTRGQPLERASVIWFSMSIYGLVTIVLALYSIPVILDVPPILGPSMANVFLALIFFGIALGTLRYRLFDVHKIWLSVILWIFAGLLFVVFDVALVYTMDLNQSQAAPFALLVAGWVYFPMRTKISELILGHREIRVSDYIPDMLERFNSVRNPEEIDGRFVNFLKTTFKVREIASIDPVHLDEAKIENHGLFLRVPMVTDGRSVKLVGRANGRQLFSSSEKLAAETFLRLVRSIHAGNVRENTRLENERRRITRDLHDDVGGRLLSLIYQSPDEDTAERAQDALQALKETVYVVE